MDSESDSDIDILEDSFCYLNSGVNSNTNNAEVDDSNDSDIQCVRVVFDTHIQVLKQIQPNEHNTDSEIIEEKKGGRLVTELNLKDDNDKNICTAKDDNNISSAQSVVLNINLSSVNEDVDSCLSSNTDICDTSFESSGNYDNKKSSIDGNSSVSVANTTNIANIPNQNSVIDSTASIGVDNTTTHPKKSLIPSDLRPKPKCKKKKPEDRYECLKCDFVTYNLVQLVYHNSEHRNTFKCKHQLCSYQTDTKHKLDRHITKHDSMKRMCFPCMKQTMICDCGECDQSSKSVVEHLTT